MHRKQPLKIGVLVGIVTALAMLVSFKTSVPAQARDFPFDDVQRFTVDVAVEHPTFAIVPGAISGETGKSTADANGNPGRGTPFIVDGKIFYGGTLPKGAGVGDPNMPGSLGTWICKGIFTSNLGTDDVGFDTTQEVEFDGDGSAIWTEGLEAGLGKQGVITHRTILGGTGKYRGAQGEVIQEALGTNVGGTPNIRLTFRIQRDH